MKKMVMMLLMILTTFLFASVASAETYEVKKGDWLAKIGRQFEISWQEIHRANKAVVDENPDKIYPGQKLTIPEKAAKTASQYKWEVPGANSFGKRDFAKAIGKFNLPVEIKNAFIAKVKSGEEFEWTEIRPGDRFEQMAFGDFKIINSVIARWKQGRLLAARLYAATLEKKTYFLIDPLICHNWAWWVEEAGEPQKKAEVMPEQPKETPKVAIPELPVKSEVSAEKPKLLLIPPTAKIVAEEKPASAPVKPPLFIFKPSVDASAFAGWSERTQGEGKGSYKGIDANLYLLKYKLGDGIFEVGPSFQYVGWKGYDYDIPMAADGHWEGNKYLYGVGSRYTTNNTETTLKARYGEKRGQFDLSQYRNEERNRLLNTELYHTVWFERKWFSDFETGFRADIDLGGSKSSWWDNNKISSSDPRSNQSEYSLSLKTEVYRGKYITPTLGISGTYARYNDFNGNNWFFTPQIGVKFFDDKASINAEYQIREGSENNAVGIGLVIEIDKMLDGLVSWFQNNQATKK